VLAAFHPLAWPVTFIGLLLFACLSLGAAGGEGYEALKRSSAERRVRRRQQARREESEQARAKFKALALKRLDSLTRSEHRILADCLRKNEQSFEGWVHSSHVQTLMAAHLVGTPGGTAHQDHYPFYIVDFAWEALQARRDEFLARTTRTESARPRSEPLRGGSFYFSSSRVIARTTSHQSGHDEDGEWLA
jgi:hypothetical protein